MQQVAGERGRARSPRLHVQALSCGSRSAGATTARHRSARPSQPESSSRRPPPTRRTGPGAAPPAAVRRATGRAGSRCAPRRPGRAQRRPSRPRGHQPGLQNAHRTEHGRRLNRPPRATSSAHPGACAGASTTDRQSTSCSRRRPPGARPRRDRTARRGTPRPRRPPAASRAARSGAGRRRRRGRTPARSAARARTPAGTPPRTGRRRRTRAPPARSPAVARPRADPDRPARPGTLRRRGRRPRYPRQARRALPSVRAGSRRRGRTDGRSNHRGAQRRRAERPTSGWRPSTRC